METKPCRICGAQKPLSDFHRSKNHRGGHHTACKPCAIAEQKASNLKPPRSTPPPGMYKCACCKEMKPLTDFHRNKSRYNGYAHTCRTCLKRAYDLDPARKADIVLRSKYKLKPGAYEEMFAAQGGKCAICGSAETRKKTGGAKTGEVRKRLAIDHCHESGSIRGLLCDGCNNGIGRLKHSPELLRKAADYLTPREVDPNL